MPNKYIKIPLAGNKEIIIKYEQMPDKSWISLMDNETMNDLVEFFQTGFYQMDAKRPITISD
jgi:hypothetical protein